MGVKASAHTQYIVISHLSLGSVLVAVVCVCLALLLQELIQMKYNTLVALYVSRLPRALQVNCYAQLLEGEEDCTALLCA